MLQLALKLVLEILDSSGSRTPSNTSFESPSARSVQPQFTISGATEGHGAAFRTFDDVDGYIDMDTIKIYV